MGIQINGQTDRISAVDGSFGIQDLAELNISGIVTAASANFTGNVSIGGTLTYQDVTNIDSVGIITARAGIDVTSGNVDIGGATHSRNLTVHDATNSVILIEGASNGTSNLMFADENDEDVGMLGYNHASNYLAFTVNAAERLRIDSSGRLLVGTTSADSNTRLHVSAAENTSDPMATDASIVIANTQNVGNNEAAALKFNVGNTNTASISAHYDSFNAGVNSSLRFYTQYQSAFNSPVERLRIDSSGHVLPGANNTYDLGSTAKGWRNVYMNDLNLSNMNGDTNDVDGTQGSWTIQEGKDNLYIINRLNGKKFKIKMEEIS